MEHSDIPTPTDGYSSEELVSSSNAYLCRMVNLLKSRSACGEKVPKGFAISAMSLDKPNSETYNVELLGVLGKDLGPDQVIDEIRKAADKAKAMRGRIVCLSTAGCFDSEDSFPFFEINSIIVVDPGQTDTVLRAKKRATVSHDGIITGDFEFVNEPSICPVLAGVAQMIYHPEIGETSLVRIKEGIELAGGVKDLQMRVPDQEARKHAWPGKVRFSDN